MFIFHGVRALSADHSPLFRSSNVADSLGLYLPAVVASRLVGLARGVILAWVLVKEEFGLLQIALVAANVMMPLAGLGLHEAMARYVPQYEARRSLRAFLARAWRFSLGVALALCAAGLVSACPLARVLFGADYGATPEGVALARWIMMGTFALIVYFLLLAVLKGLRLFRAVSLLELAGSVLFTVLAVVFALVGWAHARAVLAAHVAGYGLIIVVLGGLFAAQVRRMDEQGEPLTPGEAAGAHAVWRQMLRFSLWSAVAATLGQATQFGPMWYLQQVCGPDPTAVFGGVRLITQAVLIGTTSVIVVVQSAVTRTWESQGRQAADRRLRLAFKMTGLAMLAGCAVLSAGAPLVMRLFPAAYAGGVPVFPVMLAFFMICGFLALMVVHFVLIEKPRYAGGLWLMASVASLAFSWRLIQPGEAEPALHGAAWASLIGASVALAISLYWMRRERRPIDLGSLLLVAATYGLILPGYAAAAVVILVGVLVFASGVILDGDEKRRVRQSLESWLAGLLR